MYAELGCLETLWSCDNLYWTEHAMSMGLNTGILEYYSAQLHCLFHFGKTGSEMYLNHIFTGDATECS